jgi:hypothetical protein
LLTRGWGTICGRLLRKTGPVWVVTIRAHSGKSLCNSIIKEAEVFRNKYFLRMDFDYYLDKFKKAASDVDRNLIEKHGAEIVTGIWLDSVVLRIQKKHWANKPYEQPQSDSSIFFSVWVDQKAVAEGVLRYNIHALKLRKLNGYNLTSKEFAAAFRRKFEGFKGRWPNVRVDHGPLTLMEGWERLDSKNLQNDVLVLAGKFFEIDFIIDDLLNNHLQNFPS